MILTLVVMLFPTVWVVASVVMVVAEDNSEHDQYMMSMPIVLVAMLLLFSAIIVGITGIGFP
jgi:hypothetical protein